MFLKKDNTLMGSHIEGENYSGSTNTEFIFIAGVRRKQSHCLRNRSLEVVPSASLH
jgi:hypothetical protein